MDERASSPRGPELGRLRRREPAAVERWFRRHVDEVWAFVSQRVGADREFALDLVQDVFTRALERIEDYDPDRGTMLAWLTWSARNPIRRALALRGRASPATGGVPDEREIVEAACVLDSRPLPPEIAERRETAELVWHALVRLPERYRRALQGHYLEQRPIRELAIAEATSEGAMKVLLHRARQAFRDSFLEAAGRPAGASSPKSGHHG